MQREFESSFKPYPATSLLHATHFYFLAIFSQLFENSACHLPLVLAHVTRSESNETTTVLIKQLHLHAMSLCTFTVLNFGLCFVVVVVAVVVVVVVVVAVVVVVVVLLLLLLFAVLACIHYRGNVSLRPPLHASTFYSRTVVSMFGRRCHLLVHALSSLQVANAKCMTLRSLALVSAQRAKNTGSQQEKTSERKKTRLAAGKKRPAAEKSCFRSGEKRQQKIPLRRGKNSKQQEKTPCSSKKAPLQQKKCILEAAGKNRPRREKTRPRQEKNQPRQEKKPQQRKSSFATQKVAATEKIHFRNGKKQQPLSLFQSPVSSGVTIKFGCLNASLLSP